jgi:hypothetical protein
MSDTETEARRLLAAATEDTPPEIDLLGGFAAARRQDRSRRTRRGAVLAAGIAVVAASVTGVTLTMGSAPPALATVTSALSRTLTQSYHLSEQDSYYWIANGQIRNFHHYTCTTDADPVRHLLAGFCSTPDVPSVLEVGGYTYFYTPVTTGTHGKHWQRFLTASLPPPPCCAVNGFTSAAPQQMLAAVKQAAEVTVAGPASGPGWTGTRYAYSATLRDRTKLTGTVTVDREGRTRALALTQRDPGAVNVLVETQVLTFSRFGAPVTVTPPPADQTYSGP